MKLFCWHDWEIVSKETLVTCLFIFIIPTGEKQNLKCVKCGKEKIKRVTK